jgi:hypothetical protein
MRAYDDWLIDQISDEEWERIQQHEDAQAAYVDDWRKYDHQDHEAAAAYYDELVSQLTPDDADVPFN